MPPRLFTELLQQILALALAGYELPADRQRARHGFELVARDWLYAAQRWRELEVTEVEQINGLAVTLVSNRLAAEIEGAVGQVGEDAGAGGGVPGNGSLRAPPDADGVTAGKDTGAKVRTLRICYDAGRWGSEKALVKLFGLTPNLALLDIDLTASPAMSVVGDGLVRALAQLSQLRHFALKTGSRSPSLNIDIDALYRLTAGWPLLESFALDRFYVSARLPPFVGAAPLFAAHRHLRSLHLRTHQFRNVYDSLLGSLPEQLEVLRLNGPRVYTDPDASRSIVDCVVPVAPHLVTLAIGDSWHCTASEALHNGTFDAVLRHLDRIESLTLSPVAFKTLSTLAPLAMLRELRIFQGHASATQAVLGKELIALLHGAPRLANVSISTEVVVQWSSKQRDEAVQVAQARGIKLDC